MEINTESSEQNEKTTIAKTSRRWAGFRDIGQLFRMQWPAYIVDILVIILGITISFTLDGRKEEANRLATEHLYLISLLGDIESDIHELENRVIRNTKEIVDKTNSILILTDQSDLALGNVNPLATDLLSIMERPNFTSKDATFADLRSSGNMQLITDIKLKTSLFEYYRLYESVKAVETAEREVSNTIIAPYLVRRFSIKSMVIRKKSTLTKTEWNNVLHETEFSNAISLRFINRKELLEDYQRELGLAKNIEANLRKQIQ